MKNQKKKKCKTVRRGAFVCCDACSFKEFA
jgi:hypothetical protein